MNKKGFTLIELLAIIVILAIIAVITIPKITKITEKSRKDSASLSATGYIEAVEKYAMINSQNDDEFDMEGEYTIIDGVLSKDTNSYNINVNGTIPSNGFLTISEGDVISGCITINKYKVIIENEKVSNTTKGNCLETYTITFDSNGGSEVASINTLSGRPITKPANPTKADTKFIGWYTEEELTNKFNFNNGITEDTTLYAKWGTPSLNDDTWEEIKENLIVDRNHYTIGDTKIISFDRDGDNTNEYYNVRLINTATCGNSTGSRTSCGVVFEFITLIGEHKMNSSNTNVGGWKETSMRAYLNSDDENIYSKLPSDLQNVIIGTAPIVSGAGNGGVSENITATTGFDGDKLFLLSSREVGSDTSYMNFRETDYVSTLKYYVDNNNNNARVKYSTTTSTGENSNASFYWLRTAHPDYSTWFYGVYYTGSKGYFDANTDGGVAPAFRILD